VSAAYDIAVVMVGMTTRDFVCDSLRSIAATRWNGYTHQVIYIDNNSKDDTVEAVRREFPDVLVVAN